jgi:hypothetical protein
LRVDVDLSSHIPAIYAPFRGQYRYICGALNKLLPNTLRVCSEFNDVDEGFHSFKGWERALSLAEERNQRLARSGWARQYFVFVCIIPKGAKYFLGEFGNAVSYASDALIVLDRKDPRSLKYITNLSPNSPVKM